MSATRPGGVTSPHVGGTGSSDHGDRSLSLPRVRVTGMRQEVYQVLRDAILAKEMPLGMRLREAQIAEQLGTSRAPVREAFRQLQQEGLIECFPNRSGVVVGLPDEEVPLVYELRCLIEEHAAAQAAISAAPSDLEHLHALVSEMQAAADRGDMRLMAERDVEFHGYIIGMAGLTLLRHLWRNLDGLVRARLQQAFDRPGEIGRQFRSGTAATHRAIVDALERKDVAGARAAVRDHIMRVPALLESTAGHVERDGAASGNPALGEERRPGLSSGDHDDAVARRPRPQTR